MEIITIIFMISVIYAIVFLMRTLSEIQKETIAIRNILQREYEKLTEDEIKRLDWGDREKQKSS